MYIARWYKVWNKQKLLINFWARKTQNKNWYCSLFLALRTNVIHFQNDFAALALFSHQRSIPLVRHVIVYFNSTSILSPWHTASAVCRSIYKYTSCPWRTSEFFITLVCVFSSQRQVTDVAYLEQCACAATRKWDTVGEPRFNTERFWPSRESSTCLPLESQ